MEIQDAYNTIYAAAATLTESGQFPYYTGLPTAELARTALGVAQVESGLNPSAKNPKSTAKGLMQILDGTKKEREKKSLKIPVAPLAKMYEADYNALIGISELAYQYKRYLNDTNTTYTPFEKAVIAYKWGSYSPKKSMAYLYAWRKNVSGNDYADLEQNLPEQYAYVPTDKTIGGGFNIINTFDQEFI